jgi:hypothetical protein
VSLVFFIDLPFGAGCWARTDYSDPLSALCERYHEEQSAGRDAERKITMLSGGMRRILERNSEGISENGGSFFEAYAVFGWVCCGFLGGTLELHAEIVS